MVLVHLWPCACSDVTVYAVSPERVIVSVKVGITVTVAVAVVLPPGPVAVNV